MVGSITATSFGIESMPRLYEGNAQLISPTPTVKSTKMWIDNFASMYYLNPQKFSVGQGWGTGYSETLRLQVWLNLLSYVQNANGVPIQAYTSSDGITFTQQRQRIV